MKTLLLIPLLLISLHAMAAREVVVADSTTTTVPGVGGNAQIGYAFAKGDVITINAHASKQLQLLLAYLFPEKVMGRTKYTKQVKLSFTMPEDGIAIFRFISDRDGVNTIKYTITRLPASNAVQDYNTKIEWQMPPDHASNMIPKRVGG